MTTTVRLGLHAFALLQRGHATNNPYTDPVWTGAWSTPVWSSTAWEIAGPCTEPEHGVHPATTDVILFAAGHRIVLKVPT